MNKWAQEEKETNLADKHMESKHLQTAGQDKQFKERTSRHFVGRHVAGGHVAGGLLGDGHVAGGHVEEHRAEGERANPPCDIKPNQSRRPVKGDIISFVRGLYWVRARIRNKVAGYPHYYNVEYEDGALDGVFLVPSSKNKEQSWTLLTK